MVGGDGDAGANSVWLIVENSVFCCRAVAAGAIKAVESRAFSYGPGGLSLTESVFTDDDQLLQQLPVSAWTLNPDGTPDFVNRVWLEFAGHTLAFIRSHPEAWMTAVHPDDRERAAKSFWEGVNSGQDFAFETRSRRAKDGVYRWHLQQAVVLRDAQGKVLRVRPESFSRITDLS